MRTVCALLLSLVILTAFIAVTHVSYGFYAEQQGTEDQSPGYEDDETDWA